MLWLVDGYNVIRGVEELRAVEAGGLSRGREALVELAGFFARGKAGRRVVVFFDGPAGVFPVSGAPAGVRVVFSAGRSADSLLRERVSAEGDPGRVTVVSRDREVAGFARRSGCLVETPGDFFARLAGDPGTRRARSRPTDRRSIERELRRRLGLG